MDLIRCDLELVTLCFISRGLDVNRRGLEDCTGLITTVLQFKLSGEILLRTLLRFRL